MTWLKLTSKALYFMEGDKYIDRVVLKPHNPALEEFKLQVPLQWFQGINAPNRMAIELSPSHPEPQPLPSPPVLNVFAKVIEADSWGAAPARGTITQTGKPKYIVVHHTAHKADPNPPNDDSKGTETGAKKLAKAIQSAHFSNTWIDSGHNFLNTTGGFLLEGRHGSLEAVIKGRSVRSAHAAQDPGKLAGGNESPGIENEGNFMTFQMGKKQWDSLVELCAAICKSCNIDPDNIRGHRDFSVTDCPGDWLYAQLPKLRNEVRAKL